MVLVLIFLQHKDFEEIQDRFQKRQPLISGSTAAQRLSRRIPVEIISDPLNDMENDPLEEGTDVQRQHRIRSVQFSVIISCKLM